MSYKSTAWLIAAAMAAFVAIIFIDQPHRVKKQSQKATLLFADLIRSNVTSVQVRPGGQPEIFTQKEGAGWRMTRPLDFPANGEAVDAFLRAASALRYRGRITSEELRARVDTQKEFGFADPLSSVSIKEGSQTRRFQIGHKTPAGDQMYLQIVGDDRIYLIDTEFMDWVPLVPHEWRQTRLAPSGIAETSQIRVRSGDKGFDLVQNMTNGLWMMTWPIGARADSSRVSSVQASVAEVQVAQFVSDDPKFDFEKAGLMPPMLTLEMTKGTNRIFGLQVGSPPTNRTDMVYARLTDTPHVFLIPMAAVVPWRISPLDIRDKRLLHLSGQPLDRIEVRSQESFYLARGKQGEWLISPEPSFPLDQQLVQFFATNIARMETELEKAVETDLEPYGLKSPLAEYTLLSGSNVVAQVQFGTNQGKVFARRTDETSINVARPQDYHYLPQATWQLRDRQVWKFESTDVQTVTVYQEGTSRKLIRNKDSEWTIAEGSQGIVNTFSLEEALHRFGELRAVFWTARGNAADDLRFGFKEVDHRVVFTVNRGGRTEELEVVFGKASDFQNPYAVVKLGGERWVFEFPWPLYYEFVLRDLTITRFGAPR